MKKTLILVFISLLVMGIKLNSRAQVLEPAPRDAIYERTTITQMEPIPYVPLREADVIWSRRIWRVIDMREKINQPFYFPEIPQSGWKSFVQIVMDGLKEGTIQAYSTTSDQFLFPLSYKELRTQLDKPKKVRIPREDNPDEFIDTIIQQEFKAAMVKKLRMKEDWVFDKQRSQLEVRILGICPVGDNYDEKGEYRGDQELFWIYFPECRNLLAKNEQFNLKNGAAGRLSYDDVFMKRMFNSYIYKEENVFDRKIEEYETGVDALLEAEKAKATLFDFEQSLWEY
jgi:gliding motility associated protien GldN